ncbi:MAG: prepilin-type N-terminal cleavage/methylation domain-containing protein [Candidatus Omnitrophica bacterium]|nr:prepilin-type N-terminal cleavage/methylation domain-containing protein [Candidatus Omnitrophota bacterium]
MILPIGIRSLPVRSKKNNFRKGFTLIELALVAVLMLVIVGIAAPSIKRTLSGFVTNNAALDISKLISYAQERAIIERRYYKVRFDPAAGQYRLSASDESGDKLVYRDVPGKFGKVFSLPQGLSIKRSEDEITLYPDGTCDEFSFTVADRYGSAYLVRIKGFGTSFDMREVGIEK